MIPALQQALAPKDYEELADPIKSLYTQQEWLWLSDAEKATLVQRETEPDSWDD